VLKRHPEPKTESGISSFQKSGNPKKKFPDAHFFFAREMFFKKKLKQK
jgi:hypothetical protein